MQYSKPYTGPTVSYLMVHFYLKLSAAEKVHIMRVANFNIESIKDLSESEKDVNFFLWVKSTEKVSIVYNHVYKTFRSGTK